VGFGTPLSLVIGLILITGGLSLFFLGNFKPEIKRDSDNVYAILGIIAGILGVISFNKDIVPSIEQLLLAGMCIFLMWENIQKREPVALPPRREDDRTPRRPYRAEYEETGYSGNAGGRFGGDDRSGRGLPRRDYYDDRGSAPKNDRYLGADEPRPGRDAGRGSRRNRDEDVDRTGRSDSSWGEAPPRSIPERSSRGDRPSEKPNDRPRRDRAPEDDFPAAPPRRGNENGDVERPRRRRPEEGSERPARRPRADRDDIPAADFVEFTPEPKDTGSSWGPKD
jgi:Ycf66 protein N-terminus